MPKPKRRADLPRGCQNCRGSGYVSVQEGGLDPQTGERVRIDSTLTCSCALGVWRKEQFRKRKEEQPT